MSEWILTSAWRDGARPGFTNELFWISSDPLEQKEEFKKKRHIKGVLKSPWGGSCPRVNLVNWCEPVSEHGEVHYMTLPPAAPLYGGGRAGRGAPKIIASVSYEHVTRSVIQNPKALSSEILERGGDEMEMYVCVCVCVNREGGGCTVSPAHILALGVKMGSIAPRS